MYADYINNFVLDYVQKQFLFSIFLIIIGYKFSYKYILLTGIVILLFLIYFFRRPTINTLRSRNHLISPASGKVIKIQEREGGLLQIAIYINLWDAHVQYVPYDGIVQSQIYKPGKFHPAYIFQKSEHNEKLIHNIQTDKGLISIVQIAGVLARTIEKFVHKGQRVSQTDELGLIRFGSRCDIFIPIENKFNVLVREGQRVYGGKTQLLQFFDM